MTLRAKFNLMLGLAGLIGLAASAMLAKQFLENNARTEVLDSARMILHSARSVRGYTVSEIKPLLESQLGEKFHPQTVPAYSAHQYITRLREEYPEYNYKEATLNPTNPLNRATDWEADIVNSYNSDKEQKELIIERQMPTGERFLYLSQPIIIKDEACLSCHGRPAEAPPSMVALYGSSNGFGWKMGDIIGTQIVSIPMTLPMQRARDAFMVLLGSLVGIFLLIGILFNILLHYIVIKPVRKMADNANKVSMGKMEAGELSIAGNDEIASLSHSFNRMHRSLTNAIEILNDSDL